MATSSQASLRPTETLLSQTVIRSNTPSLHLREIDACDREDIAKTAKLHVQLLHFGPMSGLGETFVREIGYAAPVRDGRLRIVVYEVDREIVGYITFTDKALEFQQGPFRTIGELSSGSWQDFCSDTRIALATCGGL